MLNNDSLTSRILDTLLGAVVFFVVVAGATYYFQSSLILFKKYDSYTHWAVVLIGVPLVAGLIMRLMRIIYPLISSLVGAAASAGILYPQYKTFWAVPPTLMDLAVYVTVILGIGFIATQSLKTTFMAAFRLGRFSVPKFNPTTTMSKKPAQKSSPSKSKRPQGSDQGNLIPILELLMGFTSLGLSVFSIFFLGSH